MQANLQSKMFSCLVNMDLANLLAESPAALAARFSADIELARASTTAILGSITAILTIFATFAVMLSIDWALTISLIFIFLFAFGPVGIVGAKVRKISVDTQKEIARMTETVNEGLAGIRMVRTYRLEKKLTDRANATFDRLFKLRIDLTKWQSSVSPLMEILGAIAIGALLLLVALRMKSGAVDLAGFIGFLISEKFGIELVDSGDFYIALMEFVFACFALKAYVDGLDGYLTNYNGTNDPYAFKHGPHKLLVV
jgi:subfamily B ATP-binding cassette protein MsbA